jgi:hypothetical protein
MRQRSHPTLECCFEKALPHSCDRRLRQKWRSKEGKGTPDRSRIRPAKLAFLAFAFGFAVLASTWGRRAGLYRPRSPRSLRFSKTNLSIILPKNFSLQRTFDGSPWSEWRLSARAHLCKRDHPGTDASWVGLGWTFGAIVQQMRGVPDISINPITLLLCSTSSPIAPTAAALR